MKAKAQLDMLYLVPLIRETPVQSVNFTLSTEPAEDADTPKDTIWLFFLLETRFTQCFSV